MTDPQPITCDDCQQRLEEFALDELTGDVREQVARHLDDGCRACNSQLAQITADLASLAYTLPAQAPPPQIERDLLRRIAAQSPRRPLAETHVVSVPRSRISRKSLSRGLIAAAAALAAGLGGIAAWNAWQGGSTGFGFDEWAELRRRVDEANEAQQFADVPQLNFVSLRGPAPQQPVHGYVVTDHPMRQWHIYVFNLPALPEDRSYQLWFATADNRPVPAGMVKVDASGTISQVVDLPSDLPAITGLAISDEPPTGSTAPTGQHIYQADLPQQ